MKSSLDESKKEQCCRGVTLLTGCQDRSYAVGLATALASEGTEVDFIGGDSMEGPDVQAYDQIRFINLRGSQTESAPVARKAWRVLRYYARLLAYAVTAKPRVFHILWNSKFESIDRTFVMAWYRFWRRRIVLTAHNINSRERDGGDTWWNRVTLRFQYSLADAIFVHSARLRRKLSEDFAVPSSKVFVVPFGVNDTLPSTDLTREQARTRLGISQECTVGLFFGQIAPYKGLHVLVDALPEILRRVPHFHLVVAGKVKRGSEGYAKPVLEQLGRCAGSKATLLIKHVPDEEVEVVMKAADVVVLPYQNIFQSGVPFLAYYFGRGVVVTPVGSLTDDVVDQQTGLVAADCTATALAASIELYCESLAKWRSNGVARSIQKHAECKHSWRTVAHITRGVYSRLAEGIDVDERRRTA